MSSVAGILLGPSALGKIPYFNKHIFPEDSLVILNLASNIGLVFFLFVVGMEVDVRVIRRHFKAALSVGLGSLFLPFAGGMAVAYGLNKEFNDNKDTNLVVFFIFIGTAFSITVCFFLIIKQKCFVFIMFRHFLYLLEFLLS